MNNFTRRSSNEWNETIAMRPPGFKNLSDGTSDLPIGKRVKLALEQHGVLVRWFDKDGLRDCIRISVGRPDQTDRLIAALRAIAG